MLIWNREAKITLSRPILCNSATELPNILKNRHLSCRIWRSRAQHEVDFVVGDRVAIEVKAKGRISFRDYKSLNILAEEVGLKRRIAVCGEKLPRRADDGTEIMPVAHFFDELWSAKLFS